MNKIIDRTFIVEWGLTEKYLGDFQDYFGVDKLGNICSIKIQLLHNVGSKILDKEPKILAEIPKNIECSIIKKSLFLANTNLDSNCQFLYKDNIIFSYGSKSNILTDSCLIYKMLCKNTFAIFNDEMQLCYILLTGIYQFDFNAIESFFNNEKVINLFFKIYTYNQDDEVELINLINEIEFYLQHENIINKQILHLLQNELEFLKEELEL